ncbi:MAG: hypothetical protein ABIQ39_05580, partial [Ilumatobacteraceae bacterium]
ALNLLFTSLLFDRVGTFDKAVVSLPELVGTIGSASGVDTVLAYVGVLTTSLGVALVGGYVAALTVRYEFGRAVSLGACLRDVARRLPVVAVAWFVAHLWLFVVAVAIVQMPGAELAALSALVVPAGTALLAVVLFVSPVVVIERLGPLASVRRAASLARARFGACIGFVLVAGVIGLGLRFGITFLPRLAAVTGLVGFGPFGWLVEGVAGQLAQLVAVPLVALATVEMYLQMRVAVEAIDIVVAADRAFPVRDE